MKKKYFYKFNTLKQSYFFLLIWILSTIIFIIVIWLYYCYDYNLSIANKNVCSFILSFFIEQILSLDNVLIWILFFEYFKIPINFQKKVLMYGMLLSFILRFILIIISYWFILNWNWIIFIFGIMLFFSGCDMLLNINKCNNENFKKDIFFKFFMNIFRINHCLNKNNFFIYKEKILYITPLFIALIMIEISDIIFAIDSIPIILSFVKNLFIIITSNIFSILTLRSIYFIVLHFINKNKYIKYFLSFIIIMIALNIMFVNFIYVLNNIISIIVTMLSIIILTYNFSKKNIFK